MLAVRLLGGASIESDSGVATGPATHRHRLAMLAILAASHPRGVARDNLMAMLWPTAGTVQARNLLNQAVHVVRKAFGEAVIRSVGERIHLEAQTASFDVIAFEEAVARGALDSAVSLYAGPFLDGFYLPDAPDFEHWAAGERDRLRQMYCRSLEGLAREAEARGDAAGAVDLWRRLNVEDPYSAHVTISLMKALETLGDGAGALRQAMVHASLLRREFDAAPSPEVVALADRIRIAPVPAPPSGDGEDVWSSPSPALEVARDTGILFAAPARPVIIDATAAPPRGGIRPQWTIVGVLVLLLCLSSLWIIGRLGRSESVVPDSGAAVDGWSERELILVLPLENLGPPEVGYFAAGMTDEIVSRLTSIRSLGVILSTGRQPGSNEEQSPGRIGQELGAQYVLDGSVRWSGGNAGSGRVRVTPHLVRVSDGTVVWSDAFERDMTDVFAIQTEVAEAVAASVGVELGEEERQAVEERPTNNLDAYHAYLQGKYYHSRRLDFYSAENWTRAVAHFQRAVDLDSDFVLAYVGLVRAHAVLVNHGYDISEERKRMARAAMERAFELDPTAPEVWFARGEYFYFVELDYNEALAALAVAEQGIPDNPQLHEVTGFVFRRLGRWDEALERFHRIHRLQPHDVHAAHFLGQTYHLMHQYQEAARYIDLSIALAPDEHTGYREKARLYWAWTGDLAAARAALEAVPTAHADQRDVVHAWIMQEIYEGRYVEALRRYEGAKSGLTGVAFREPLLEAQLYRLVGETERARDTLDAERLQLEEVLEGHPRDPGRYPALRSRLGIAYAGLGRVEEAVREGEAALAFRPLSVDGLTAPHRLLHLAQIYAMVGEYDAAMEQIETLLSVPSWLSISLLRIDPRWAPLHDFPRFQALVSRDQPRPAPLTSASGG